MNKKCILILMGLAILAFSGCVSSTSIKKTWNDIKPDPTFKKLTPEMELEITELMQKGCDREYPLLEKKTAMLYSIIPGGGQFYTGETKKGLWYMAGSFLIVPYFISFDDAQSSVDFINARNTIKHCKEKLRLMQEKQPGVEKKADASP